MNEGKMNAALKSKKPPDLKIDLLSDTSSMASTVSPRYIILFYSWYFYVRLETIEMANGKNLISLFFKSRCSDLSKSSRNQDLILLGAPGNVSDMRRHSHTYRASKSLHISAPVTPLNRSTTNVNSEDQS